MVGIGMYLCNTGRLQGSLVQWVTGQDRTVGRRTTMLHGGWRGSGSSSPGGPGHSWAGRRCAARGGSGLDAASRVEEADVP
jgi:hypothetical protein